MIRFPWFPIGFWAIRERRKDPFNNNKPSKEIGSKGKRHKKNTTWTCRYYRCKGKL